MKKMVLLLVLSALLITGASAAFTDVPAKAWYAQAVDRVAAKGMMSGTSESTFSPTAPVTRGTVVTVLWRLAGTPKMPSGNLFPDISAGCWYAESANWARLLGIADGYSSGDFGGDDPVTREQLALFLYRYTKYIGGELAQGVLTGYRDSGKISPWALDGLKHAVGAGLITGDTAGRLNPKGHAQRAELAMMLVRFLTPAAG